MGWVNSNRKQYLTCDILRLLKQTVQSACFFNSVWPLFPSFRRSWALCKPWPCGERRVGYALYMDRWGRAHVEEERMMGMEFAVKVEGACPACSQRCPFVELERVDLFENNAETMHVFRCVHRDECRYAFEKSQMLERDKP